MTNSVMSVWLANKTANFILGKETYFTSGSYWLALYHGHPESSDRNAGELTGGSYVRKQVSFTTPTNRQTKNSDRINFDTATADWGEIGYVGIRTASAPSADRNGNDNLLFYCEFSDYDGRAIDVLTGERLIIDYGQLNISLNYHYTDTFGTYLLGTFLNSASAVSSCTTGSSVYVGLGTVLVNPPSPPVVTELSATGYARKQVHQTQWGEGNPWYIPVDGLTTYGSQIQFTTAASATWGNIGAVMLFSASASGSTLCWEYVDLAPYISTNDALITKAANLSIQVE